MGCQSKQDIKEIKLGHSLDVSHTVHQAMVYMADRLYEKSKGTVSIKIYPNEQLGTERQLVELLQIGSLGMTKVSSGTLENFAPGMKVFGVPFLFQDKSHGYRVLDGVVGEHLLKESEKYWLKGLVFYDAGFRSFYTREKLLQQPTDLQGMKIRVMPSVTAVQMMRALGGSPTPIAWGEIYSALQQGIVDGAENNPPSFYLSRHYEACRYYILDEHTYLPDVLIMSTSVWQSLTAVEQSWLMEAAKESVAYQRKLWQQAELEALVEVQKAGIEVIRPDKSLFKSQVESLLEVYQQDPDIKSFLPIIESLAHESQAK